MTAIQQEMHEYIDDLPDDKLYVLRPLLRLLRGGMDDELIIETDLTDEEKQIIAEGRKEYLEHPETFVKFSDILRDKHKRD
ncbi:MAG: hypothetical protein LBD16_03005 [Oscillospiraceae bacterium]|jgi:hypothetical protein|nr:hypothetical protein [Oscillospiraceae bacterium]